MLPSVYDSLHYRQFLRRWYDAKKKANPRFSHRMFVRRTGQRSPSLLADVMEGRRNLTQAGIEGFCRALSLDEEAAEFFAELVRFDQAETPREKNRVWIRLSKTRRFRDAFPIEGDLFAAISHWYYAAARELVFREDFVFDPAWVAGNLRPNITEEQAAAALDTLHNLGLLVQEEGAWVAGESTAATGHEITSLAARNYHVDMAARAQEAIERYPGEERHFCGVTAAIPASLLPELKRELNDMQKRLLDMCDGAEGPRHQVVQLNLQLFPLSSSDDP